MSVPSISAGDRRYFTYWPVFGSGSWLQVTSGIAGLSSTGVAAGHVKLLYTSTDWGSGLVIQVSASS